MIVQQLVVILVLSQEGVSTRPSTLPSWTNLNSRNLNQTSSSQIMEICIFHSQDPQIKAKVTLSQCLFLGMGEGWKDCGSNQGQTNKDTGKDWRRL